MSIVLTSTHVPPLLLPCVTTQLTTVLPARASSVATRSSSRSSSAEIFHPMRFCRTLGVMRLLSSTYPSTVPTPRPELDIRRSSLLANKRSAMAFNTLGSIPAALTNGLAQNFSRLLTLCLLGIEMHGTVMHISRMFYKPTWMGAFVQVDGSRGAGHCRSCWRLPM